MDNFDKRIKQIAKDENWEIPNEIDNNISKLLKNIEEPKTVRKRQLKVAILVASLSILTITTAFAIENVIEYFNYNKNSEYISSKEELETRDRDCLYNLSKGMGKELGLCANDQR